LKFVKKNIWLGLGVNLNPCEQGTLRGPSIGLNFGLANTHLTNGRKQESRVVVLERSLSFQWVGGRYVVVGVNDCGRMCRIISSICMYVHGSLKVTIHYTIYIQ
jgi:hypothetical protein